MHLGERWRVDVEQGSTASRLLVGPDGSIACQVPGAGKSAGAPDGSTTCLLVASPERELPELFDPGIQRIFAATLPRLAGAGDVTVTATTSVPAAGSLAAAACYQVSGDDIDRGEYCLSDDGVLRRAAFATGTLDLTSYGDAPAAPAFAPPVTPTPLPD
jgi:hypothetical protein